MRHIGLIILFAAIFAMPALAVAQDPQTAQGFAPSFNPNASFQSTNIDHVDMNSGNVAISIPLFSLPQRGSFKPITFSLVANTTVWGGGGVCYQDSHGDYILCTNSAVRANQVFGTLAPPSGVTITANIPVPDTDLETPPDDDDSGFAYYARVWNFVDRGSYGVHQAFYDMYNPAELRSADGSGYLLKFDSGDSWYDSNNMDLRAVGGPNDNDEYRVTGHNPSFSQPPYKGNAAPKPIVYDRDGHHSETVYDSNSSSVWYGDWYTSDITDTDNNKIIFPHNTTTFIPQTSDITTDTIGRSLHLTYESDSALLDDTNPTNIAARCPNLHVSTQQVVGYSTRSFVDIYGSPGTPDPRYTYTLCYALITEQTNMWNMNGVPPIPGNYPAYDELNTGGYYIQSVVMPDGTYWGFLYDNAICSGSPVECTTAWGNVTKVITPQGGAISYCYGSTAHRQIFVDSNNVSQEGDVPILSRRLQQTTAGSNTDACGASSDYWSYTFAPPISTTPQTTTIIDPANDKMVAQFDDAGDEASEDIYQYSSGGYTLLQHKAITYAGSRLPDPFSVSYFNYKTEEDEYLDGTYIGKTLWNYTSGVPDTFTGIAWRCNENPGGTYEQTCGYATVAGTLYIGNLYSTATYGSTGSSPLKKTINTYHSDSCAGYLHANFISLPSTVQVTDGANFPTTTYGYDNETGTSCSGSIFGHLYNTNVAPGIDIGNSVNSYGMVASNTDPKGTILKSFTYDSTTHAFPISVMTPDGSVGFTYDDYNDAQVESYTDLNGSVTHLAYDNMRRPFTVQYQDAHDIASNGQSEVACYTSPTQVKVYQAQGATTLSATLSGAGAPYTGMTGIADSSACPTTGASGAIVQTENIDGLGRVSSTVARAPEGDIQVDTTYDVLGRIYSVSNPYFVGGSISGWTVYGYDGLSRQNAMNVGTTSLTTLNGNSKSRSFAGPSTTTIDGNSNQTQVITDILGRITDVYEPAAASTSPTLHTGYAYSLFGVTDVCQYETGIICERHRIFGYDTLGRLTSIENPETGTVYYTYPTSGSIYSGDISLPHTKTDARGLTQTIIYDTSNRLLSKTYSDATPTSCYRYNTVSGGKGLLGDEWTQIGTSCAASPGDAGSALVSQRSVLSYDKLGRITEEEQCTLGVCSNTSPPVVSYMYDLSGKTTYYTNGMAAGSSGATAFENTYDAAGRLLTLTSSWDDWTHPGLIFAAQAFSATGLTNANLGNHLNVTNVYDPLLRIYAKSVVAH